MDPGQRGVERELADGDAHSTGALVPKAENAFSVADHDAADLIKPGMGQDPGDPILMGIAEKETSRFAPDLAEALAAFPHRRGVDQRQHLFNIARQQRVEKGLIGVLKLAQKSVLLESRRQTLKRSQTPFDLVFQIAHMGRQQAVQPENVPLLVGEGGSLIQHRLVDQVIAGE